MFCFLIVRSFDLLMMLHGQPRNTTFLVPNGPYYRLLFGATKPKNCLIIKTCFTRDLGICKQPQGTLAIVRPAGIEPSSRSSGYSLRAPLPLCRQATWPCLNPSFYSGLSVRWHNMMESIHCLIIAVKPQPRGRNIPLIMQLHGSNNPFKTASCSFTNVYYDPISCVFKNKCSNSLNCRMIQSNTCSSPTSPNAL